MRFYRKAGVWRVMHGRVPLYVGRHRAVAVKILCASMRNC